MFCALVKPAKPHRIQNHPWQLFSECKTFGVKRRPFLGAGKRVRSPDLLRKHLADWPGDLWRSEIDLATSPVQSKPWPADPLRRPWVRGGESCCGRPSHRLVGCGKVRTCRRLSIHFPSWIPRPLKKTYNVWLGIEVMRFAPDAEFEKLTCCVKGQTEPIEWQTTLENIHVDIAERSWKVFGHCS